MATLKHRTPFRYSDAGARPNQMRQPLLAASSPAFDPMTALEALRTKAMQSFDEDDPRHVLALETLWQVSFHGEGYERVSQKWKELGFQNVDPISDLRGGGFVALEHLVRFVVRSRGAVVGDASFPTAIASISVTAMLLRHFGLHPTLLLTFPGAREQPESSTAALRNLLELQHGNGTDALQALHYSLMMRLARAWEELGDMQLSRGVPPRTIMDFPRAQTAAYRHLCVATATLRTPWGMMSDGVGMMGPSAIAAAAAAVEPPQAWLDAVCERLETQTGPAGGFGGGGGASPLECCANPAAGLAAVLLVLLRSLTGQQQQQQQPARPQMPRPFAVSERGGLMDGCGA